MQEIFSSEGTFPYHAWIISALTFELILVLFLHYRQYSHISSVHEVPRIIDEFADGIYTSVDLEFSRGRTLDYLWHNAGKKAYKIVLWMIVIQWNVIYEIWGRSELSPELWPRSLDAAIGRNVLFAALAFVIYEIVMIPVSVNFQRLKEKYGDHDQRRSIIGRRAYLNIAPYLKKSVNNFATVIVFAAVLSWFLNTLSQKTFFTQSVIITSFFYVYILMYPSIEIYYFIHGSQMQRAHVPFLFPVCDSVGFRRKHLICLKRPPDTGQDNAFYYGFLWFRRIIVLYDTTATIGERNKNEHHELDTILTKPEVEAIVAHELGHWKFDHSNADLLIWHGLHISTIILTLVLRATSLGVFKNVGLPATQKDVSDGIMILPATIIADCLLLRLYKLCFEFIHQLHKHKCENEADRFAAINLRRGKNLGRALVKLTVASNTFPSQDPWYSLCYHSHVGLVTRLRHIFIYMNARTHQKSE